MSNTGCSHFYRSQATYFRMNSIRKVCIHCPNNFTSVAVTAKTKTGRTGHSIHIFTPIPNSSKIYKHSWLPFPFHPPYISPSLTSCCVLHPKLNVTSSATLQAVPLFPSLITVDFPNASTPSREEHLKDSHLQFLGLPSTLAAKLPSDRYVSKTAMWLWNCSTIPPSSYFSIVTS